MSEPAWVPLGGAVPVAVPLVTALPGSPFDGQECILTDSLTAGTYFWHLRYVAAKASNKWVFVGGPPQLAEVATAEGVAGTAYIDAPTVGPSIALPVAGDYVVGIGFRRYSQINAATRYMSYAIGGTAAVDADAAASDLVSGGSSSHNVSRFRKKLGLGAVTLTAKYRSTAAASETVGDRWMQVTPIAVGG